VSDGAAAVWIGTDPAPVRFVGWERGIEPCRFVDRPRLDRFDATARAAARLYERTGLGPDDVDVVEIHDAFSSFQLINLEALGFAPEGLAWERLEAGDFRIGGRWAVNPSGGLKARGHPIGACGLSSVWECDRQLRGRAGRRQHPGARIALIQSAGGVSQETELLLLERTGKDGSS
jgi:acetyl-CoA acetyltransferase